MSQTVPTAGTERAPLKRREFLHGRKFRIAQPSARAFLAPQRERVAKVQHPKPPKPPAVTEPSVLPERSTYRGKDNPRAGAPASTAGGAMALSDRTRKHGGAKSRRRTARTWVAS
jgi:hypothetical protein